MNQSVTRYQQQPAVPSDDIDLFKLGKTLAMSGYFQDTKDEAQAVVKILYGRELGVAPVSALMGIHIIQGKPAPSAGLMASIIKRSGKYNYRVKQLDDGRCDLEFFEDGQSVGVSSFTHKDAEAAGALSGKNAHTWKSFKRNMLFARALSNGARWYCPDVFGGPVYTPEEMDVAVDGETGEVVHKKAKVTVMPPSERVPIDAEEARDDPVANGVLEGDVIAPDDLPFETDQPEPLVDQDDYIAIDNARKAAGVKANDLLARIKARYKVESIRELTQAQAAELIAEYKAMLS